ncbi:hypothetical protein C8R44DRAFT_891876 [Mycena epipterygia]|nr:hypothetical protein C8R44DRAFT_891876 [Mycena epipterygia]
MGGAALVDPSFTSLHRRHLRFDAWAILECGCCHKLPDKTPAMSLVFVARRPPESPLSLTGARAVHAAYLAPLLPHTAPAICWSSPRLRLVHSSAAQRNLRVKNDIGDTARIVRSTTPVWIPSSEWLPRAHVHRYAYPVCTERGFAASSSPTSSPRKIIAWVEWGVGSGRRGGGDVGLVKRRRMWGNAGECMAMGSAGRLSSEIGGGDLGRISARRAVPQTSRFPMWTMRANFPSSDFRCTDTARGFLRAVVASSSRKHPAEREMHARRPLPSPPCRSGLPFVSGCFPKVHARRSWEFDEPVRDEVFYGRG